jgi:putative heme-binding domain-containing protein
MRSTAFLLTVSSVFLVAVAAARPQDVASPQTLDAYREAAILGGGDVERGRAVFDNKKSLCATCHTVDGQGGKAGPDLRGVGDKFERPGLARALLEPSADILPGYPTTIIQTQSGQTVSGILKFVGDRDLELAAGDGQTVRVPKSDVEVQRTSEKSLMPDNVGTQLAQAEFVDLVAYLETLRLPRDANRTRPDNPDQIARAAKPLTLTPFHGRDITWRRPVWFGPLAGHPDNYLVVEVEPANIWRLEKTATGDRKHPFGDLSNESRRGYVEGLLGFTLHPKFVENHRYFLAMHEPASDRVIVNIWERKATDDGLADSGTPPKKILSIETPHVNHNGCCLEFGSDGDLYISCGDGGPQEDPNGYSQNPQSLLGKILRINVDHATDAEPYSIPQTNPFVGDGNTKPEIWAMGFREPWRFTFDRNTNDLWVGDVGQGAYEEVDLVRAGDNLGWNVLEGFTPFSARYRKDDAHYKPPVLSYSHRHGVSVTGGYVYRGQKAPALQGMYIFGDFETRRIWGLTQKDGRLTSLVELGRSPSRIAAFGEDNDGELFLVGHDPGVVYRLNLSEVDPTPMELREIAATSEKAGLLWHTTLNTPPTGWEQPDFDDHTWARSPGGFGTRGTPGAMVRTEWRSRDIWLRREFQIDAGATDIDAGTLALRMHHDEDAEVYLNGDLVADPRQWTGGYAEFPLDERATRALRAGRNVIAIHCRQNGGGQYIDAGIVQYVKATDAGKSSPSGQ